MFFGRLTLLSLSHNLLDSLALLALFPSPLLQVRISVADPDPPDPHVFGPPVLAQPLPQPPGQPLPAGSVLLPTPRGENRFLRIRIHMFLSHLTSLSLSHNLLDSLAQLAVFPSPLLQVRISVADPDPHVFGPPVLAQPLPQPPGQPLPAGSVLLPTS
jgi:hypothetical protein